MHVTLPINPAESPWHNALDTWQAWSDATFDEQYSAALLTLVEGLATLTGYLIGFTYCWLTLQLMTSACYGLSEAIQVVPVLNSWWTAPFIQLQPTPYPDSCWQAVAPAVAQAIFDYELSWAGVALQRHGSRGYVQMCYPM